MPQRLLIRNASVFDSAAGRLRPHCKIVIEGERIAAVSEAAIQVDDAARIIDVAGRVVLPGLIDAHVHVVAASHDLTGLALQPPSLVSAKSSRIMSDMLQRGFTTVRDAAGADFGLQEAVESGPRACASASSSAVVPGSD
jgi:imidazolonepropionase-like amidohydrolase